MFRAVERTNRWAQEYPALRPGKCPDQIRVNRVRLKECPDQIRVNWVWLKEHPDQIRVNRVRPKERPEWGFP
jgi:hypothetical protein